MATQVQFRGGTTSQHGSFTGAVREVTVDTDKETLVVHDGSTAGGFALLRESSTQPLTITTADNNAQLTLASTDADSSSGAILEIQRDSASPADGDAIGQIKFTADNDAGQSTLYGTINGTLRDASDGTEDGQMQFSAMVNGSSTDFLRYGVGGDAEIGVIFNEGSIDADFRVESNADANALFVEGSTSNVCINVATGNSANNGSLTIGHSGITKITGTANGNADELILIGANASANVGMSIISNNANQGIIYFGDEDDTDIGGIIYDHSTNDLAFQTNTSEKLRVKSGGDLSINDGNLVVANGHGIDFSAVGNVSGMSSELLNTYEEGSWSPQLFNGSSNLGRTSLNATYTKIGRTVYAEFQIGRDDTSSDTNVIQIGGLPFTSRAGPRLAGQAWVDNTSSDIKCFLYIGSSEANATLFKTGDNNSAVHFNEFDNGRFIYGAIVYNT